MKLSDIITELVEMLLLWMKNNSIVRNESLPMSERKKAVDECERLINLEYELVDKIDKVFK